MTIYTTIDDATTAIQAHPACESFEARTSSYVIFYKGATGFPDGITAVRGALCDDLKQLNRLYSIMDRWYALQPKSK